MLLLLIFTLTFGSRPLLTLSIWLLPTELPRRSKFLMQRRRLLLQFLRLSRQHCLARPEKISRVPPRKALMAYKMSISDCAEFRAQLPALGLQTAATAFGKLHITTGG